MRGDLTAAARLEFDREVAELLAAAPSLVTVDMSDVTSLESAWLDVLTQLRTRVGREGPATLQFSAVSPPAREMLELGGFAPSTTMPTSPSPAEVQDAAKPMGALGGTGTATETGALTSRVLRESRVVTVPVGAALTEPRSSASPSTAGGRFAWAPPMRRAQPVHTIRAWFAGRTDLQKLSLVGVAGAFVVALLTFGTPRGSQQLTGYTAPSRDQFECATRYGQQDDPGAATDRNLFLRNCVAAGQAMLGETVELSPPATTKRTRVVLVEEGSASTTAAVDDPAPAVTAAGGPSTSRKSQSALFSAATTAEHVASSVALTTTAETTTTTAATTTTSSTTTTTTPKATTTVPKTTTKARPTTAKIPKTTTVPKTTTTGLPTTAAPTATAPTTLPTTTSSTPPTTPPTSSLAPPSTQGHGKGHGQQD